jgi:LPXTG-motif cell wall-anchored protein
VNCTLPQTGTNLTLAVVGFGLVAAGIAFVAIARRRNGGSTSYGAAALLIVAVASVAVLGGTATRADAAPAETCATPGAPSAVTPTGGGSGVQGVGVDATTSTTHGPIDPGGSVTTTTHGPIDPGGSTTTTEIVDPQVTTTTTAVTTTTEATTSTTVDPGTTTTTWFVGGGGGESGGGCDGPECGG